MKNTFPFYYFYTRVYPLWCEDKNDYDGVMEIKINKTKINNLKNYIDLELDIQEKIFKKMGCDEQMIKETLLQMRITYESNK
jgi:hypothetical protein